MYNLFKLHSVLGKIVFLALIMIASHYHMLFGVLAVLLYMLLTQYTIEGMKNMEINEDNEDSKDSKDNKDSKDEEDGKDNSAKDAIAKFKIDNCKDGKLMKDNKEIHESFFATPFFATCQAKLLKSTWSLRSVSQESSTAGLCVRTRTFEEPRAFAI